MFWGVGFFAVFISAFPTSTTVFTVAFPWTSLFIVNTGASPHAPTHLVASIENLPSGVVSPSSILSLSSIMIFAIDQYLAQY